MDLQQDVATIGLVFVLGLRHGLDPDHIAIIDNLTLRALGDAKRWAAWTGTLFALGHSLSVAAVALAVAWAATNMEWPKWIGTMVDWLVITLLLLVAAINTRALTRSGPYHPRGWRSGLLPPALREVSHPIGVVAVGMIFGLVFDTATQAAAWGLSSSTGTGLAGAAILTLAFASGMVLTDTLDSQLIARLMRDGMNSARAEANRRAVGALVVALSLSMAGYALIGMFTGAELSDTAFTALGAFFACTVIYLCWLGRRAALRPEVVS